MHDQAGLICVVDVECGVASFDDHSHVSPFAGLHVGVGLVDSRGFAAQTVPGPFGFGGILHGVIADEAGRPRGRWWDGCR